MSSIIFPIVIMVIFLIFGIMAITGILCYMRSNRLVIRRDVDGKSIIDGYFWMLPRKSKKDGTVYWVSVPWQRKLKIQEPPNEVMDINNRGKKWVEVFRLSEDEYVFIKDCGIDKDSHMLSYTREVGKGKELKQYAVKDLFQPFSLVQRETIIHQYKKANAEKDRDKLSMLINNIPVIVLGMVVIIGMIYAGEISNAFSKVGAQADGLLSKAAKVLQSAKSSVQEIAPQKSSGVSKAGEEPPRQAG